MPQRERRNATKSVVVDRRKYVAQHVDVKEWWGPSSLQPTIVVGQLNAHYVAESGPIRHQNSKDYENRLIEVLRFAELQNADFCVLPEFSCPLSAAKRIVATLPKKARTAYVLPFEHVTVSEYKELLRIFDVAAFRRKEEAREIELMLPSNTQDGIVNAALTLIPKTKGFEVIPQRKLRPAKLEEFGSLSPRFVKGRTIRIIHARRCTFAVLICFDFITRDAGARERPRDVLSASEPEDDLDLLFVPECNPQPLHDFYLMSAIDLYQAPAWAERRPAVLLNNVAAGSTLGSYPAHFGFTRLLGAFGKVTPSAEIRHVPGFVSSAVATSLADLASATIVKDDRIGTVLLRPEQSVFIVNLPLRAGSDREVSDTNTAIEIFRPLGRSEQWERVHELPMPAPPAQAGVRAEEGSPRLAGVSELQRRFRELASRETILAVTGPHGAGKTTFVSTTLKDIARPPHDLVIWLDLATLEQSEAAIVEEVLSKLGRARDLALTLDKQYEAVADALRSQPTVLVLDSADAWGTEPLPARLLRLHGWKTLVVVAGQTGEASLPEGTRVLEVTNLELPDFSAVVREFAQVPMPTLTLTMFNCSKGSARVAAWTGQFIQRNLDEAKVLDDGLAQIYDDFIAAEAADEGRATDSLLPVVPSDREPPINLGSLFAWFESRLTEPACDVLEVLCEMPAGLRTEDLAVIVDRDDVAHLVELLDDRNLLQVANADGVFEHTRYTSHPFVRQLWEAAELQPEPMLQLGMVRWVERVLGQYTRDRDPMVSPIVLRQWPNIAHVLRLLAASPAAIDRRKFLELWRQADQFLWAAGRWRERLSFGRTAEETARRLGDRAAEISALYDAQAKTLWHRYGTKDGAESLINKAAAIAAKYKLKPLRVRIEWYRSRMLLHVGDFKGALTAATHAVSLADSTKDLQARVTSRIGLANALRDADRLDEALTVYAAVRQLLVAVKGISGDESRAVLDRNEGRVYLRKSSYEDALRKLRSAMEAFVRLGLVVQVAETAVYYAEALARVGEPATAERHLNWGRERLDPLGSALRQRSIARAVREIEEAKRGR